MADRRNRAPGIRKEFSPHRPVTQASLEDYFNSLLPGGAQTKREAQLGSEGRTPWIINGGSVTDEMIKALRQETGIREYPERGLRPSSGRQTDDQAASSATRTHDQTVAVHGTLRKPPTLPMTRVDPAYAARNVEHNFTEEDFKGFAEWKGYQRLRSSYSERNDTYKRHGDRTSSIGSLPQPYQSAPHPNLSNALRSTDGSGGDDDGDDEGDNVSDSRYESDYGDTYIDFPDGTSDHRSLFARYGGKYKYTDASASRYSDEHDASTNIALDESSIVNPFKRRGILLDLPIVLGNGTRTENQVNAIPDTGATLNVISCRCLKDTDPKAHAQLSARRSLGTRSLAMADGSLLSTLGEVKIPCSFPDDPANVMQIAFHICATLAENICVIVGKEFLETTKSLTIYAHRMTERPIGLHAIPWVMRLAPQDFNSRSQLRILVDSKPTLTCPDTGSEIDLFSASFAQSIGVQVRALLPSDPTRIQYANGRHERILGKAVVDVSIEKDRSRLRASGQCLPIDKDNSDFELLSSDGKSRTESEPALSRQRTFYLVQGLACNIILGQAFLYSIDAYNTYKYAFVESGAPNGTDTLNGIFVTGRTRRQNTSPTKPSKFLESRMYNMRNLT